MSGKAGKPKGYLALVLHAHLPYVVNHGTWPHGMEWLLEAAAETYLPLLRVLRRLENDGVHFRLNLNLSPVLLEQLAHPVFQENLPRYLERKVVAAREDEAFFEQAGESHYAGVARFWQAFYGAVLDDLRRLGNNIIAAFRHFSDKGVLEIVTCSATHGYNPLLGTDESIRAQIRTAVQTHRRHFGRRPRGIWLPECGYRPAGFWNFPVAAAGEEKPHPGLFRIGLEQAVAESGLEFFFVDSHLVEDSLPAHSPYSFATVRPSQAARPQQPRTPAQRAVQDNADRNLYRPHTVAGPYENTHAVSVFPRDPRTGLQVWSGETGYPGDPVYLDFHKKRWPGGHRYWQVTGPGVSMADKLPYHPQAGVERTRDHARHFLSLVSDALAAGRDGSRPPVLCAPFDAELFGHWWFEGVLFLENVIRELAAGDLGFELTGCNSYLDRFGAAEAISMPEGSWGANGDNSVWLSGDTAWTWSEIYPAEFYTREVCTHGEWRDGGLGERIVKQMCRELLLLESSDWQFLITTGAARDYAEKRFHEHREQFEQCRRCWQHFDQHRELTEDLAESLRYLEERDGIFPDINPEFWVLGAKEAEPLPPEPLPVSPPPITIQSDTSDSASA